MKKIILLLALSGSSFGAFSQDVRIRKHWRELTQDEADAYVAAANTLYNDGIVSQFVTYHANHGQHANMGMSSMTAKFLPWHRRFIYYMESEMKVPLPYWDWEYPGDWSENSSLFSDGDGVVDGSSIPGGPITEDGLFGQIIAAANNQDFSRNFDFNDGHGTPSGIVEDLVNNYPNYLNFVSAFAEGSGPKNLHGRGHVVIGGAQNSTSTSPIDPIFYLHHSMVDKVYQDWFNANGITSGVIPSDLTQVKTGVYENMADFTDLRDQKVWYANDRVLLLDEYTASLFERYDYTTGEIIATTFVIPTSVTVNYCVEPNYSITLKDGFHAQEGSVFSTYTDGSCPGLIFGRSASNQNEESTRVPGTNNTVEASEALWVNQTAPLVLEMDLPTLDIYPNPSNGQFRITMPHSLKRNSSFGSGSEWGVESIEVTIYDLQGRVAYSKDIDAGASDFLDVELLESGTYLVNLRNNQGKSYSQMLIIK